MTFILSVLYFISFSLYVYMGFIIMEFPQKSGFRKPLFMIMLSLGVWALGLSLGISAPTIKTSIAWYKLAATGLSFVLPFLLHFTISINGYFNKKAIALYIPGFIIFYFSVVAPGVYTKQYVFEQTHLGWMNQSMQSQPSQLFLIYVIACMFITVFMIHKWMKTNKFKPQEFRPNLVFILLVTGGGLLIELAFNIYSGFNGPPIAPFLILISTIFIYLSIKKYNFLSHESSEENELILTSKMRNYLYYFIAVSLLSGAFFNSFSSQHYGGGAYLNSNWVNIVLFTSGLFIIVIRHLNLSNLVKDNILVMIIYLFIPASALYSLNRGAITTWSGPFIVIVLFAVFNNRKIISILTVSILVSQFITWTFSPTLTISLSHWDHLMRLAMYAVVITLSVLVNNIYISKLKQNKHQLQVQKLIGEISTAFLSVTIENKNTLIDNTLKKVGVFYNFDCTNLVLFDHDRREMVYSNEWVKNEDYLDSTWADNIPFERSQWWISQLQKNQVIWVEAVDKMGFEAGKIKNFLENRRIKSAVALPVWRHDILLGFVGLEDWNGSRKTNDEMTNNLRVISNILAEALTKVDAEFKQHQLAYYDALTGLPNRLMFTEKLDEAIENAESNGSKVAVYFLDLDSFKIVNDTVGHEAGDKLLCNVANMLSENAENTEFITRFGGDEFLIIHKNIDSLEKVNRFADKLIKLFESTILVEDQEFNVTVSAGIALYPEDGVEANTLVKNADLAMYKAKENGKNQYVFCSDELKDQAKYEIELSNSLHKAIERNELYLVYQPQVDIESNQITAVEALLRWNHSKLGNISPGVFIPIAEKNGFINTIGDWVLETAIGQNKNWQVSGHPPIRMAINISVNQFRSSDFLSNLSKKLMTMDLDAKYVELELTESLIIEEFESVVNTLKELKKMGVSISIDDFGTGYSSLARLKELPIDRLKLDMQFVQNIVRSEKDYAIAQVVINMAKQLKLRVIAEGVETLEQLGHLTDMECDEVQGYYYYKPMKAEQIDALLKQS